MASAWRAFDFYVRARIDVLFDRTPRFDSARLNGIVYAHAVPTFKNWAANRSTLVWRDWLYVASFDGISHIANVVDPIISPRERCYGACPEEQIVLQLRRHKYELVPFRDPLTLTREGVVPARATLSGAARAWRCVLKVNAPRREDRPRRGGAAH